MSLLIALSLTLLQQVSPASATPAAPVEAVHIDSPAGYTPVFGKITVAASVEPFDARPEKVEFYVDGRFIGADDEPPYAVEADVGEDNMEHEFEVAAYDGETILRGSLVTPRIDVNEEVNVRLMQLYVSVEDRQGNRVTDLTRDQFRVLDSVGGGLKREQEIVTFFTGETPFTAVLLIDASTSMRGRNLATAIDGAKAFVDAIGPSDQGKLVLFSDRIRRETPFTNLVSLLGLGLGGLEASGGTALNDAIYTAIKRLDGRQGRKVVIMLSDGIDVDSVLPIDQVQWVANRNTDVLFYWIRLRQHGSGTRHRSAWRSLEQHDQQAQVLQQLVKRSGGEVFDIHNVSQVDVSLQQVLSELRQQYVIGFYPDYKVAPGTWHNLEVRVDAPGHTATTRDQYLER